MAKTVDTRVVEMRFDNKQFKQAASESLSLIDRLKQALNFSGAEKEFNKINKAVKATKMDPLLASVQNLEKRFSILGIAGMQTVQNITNAMTGKLVRGFNFVNDAIVNGGKRRAMNIENAHFQLQALLKDEAQVQAVMKDANDSVTGTAYAYDEAAKAASMFAASGMRSGAEMQQALAGVAGVAAMTNSEYAGIAQIFTTVAGNGRLMGDELLQLSSRGLNAAATIADYFNGVNAGAIQASDDVRASIANLTGGLQVSERDIREFVSKGEVSFKLFAGAMNNAFGDSAKRANETFTGSLANMKSALGRIGAEFYSPLIEQNGGLVQLFNALRDRINEVKKALTFDAELKNTNALSKQFTDTVLAMAASVTKFVKEVDLEKPISIFYHGVETVKNVAKGAFSVIKPFGLALKDTFGPSLDPSNLDKLAARLESFTAKLKMSDETSKNLQYAFKGLFDVVKLGINVFVKLLSAILPIGEPISHVGSSAAEAAGNLGKLVSKVTEWVSESPTFNKSFEIIGKGVDFLVTGIGTLIKVINDLLTSLYKLPITQKFLNQIKNVLDAIGEKTSGALNKGIKSIGEFSKSLRDMVPEKANEAFDHITKSIANFAQMLRVSKPAEALQKLKTTMSDIYKIFRQSEGVDAFVTNIKQYFKDLSDAFTVDALVDKLNTFKSKVGEFLTWIRDVFAPVLKDLDFGTLVSAGTGVVMGAGLLNLGNAFKSIAASIKEFKLIPETFGGIKDALKAYERDLNADAILKVAGAISVLGAAVTVMSFADPGRLKSAALALSMLAGVLLVGVTKFTEAMNQAKTMTDVANTAVKGITGVLNKLTRALEIKAIAELVKSFAISIGVIVASIAGLAYAYYKDADAVNQAVDTVGKIAVALLGITAAITLIANVMPKGAKAAEGLAAPLLAFSVSLGIVVLSLTKLMEMQIPSDYKAKLKILAGIFGGLVGVILAVGLAGRISGQGKVSALAILAVVPLLNASVKNLIKLFKMELPSDYKAKVKIMAGIFAGVSVILLAVGKASQMAGKGKVAATTIAATSGLLYTSVKAIRKLFEMELPSDYKAKVKIMAGIFLGIGGLMLVVGKAASMSEGGLKAGGTILSIAGFLGSAVTALGVLQFMDWKALLPAAVALGGVLLALAVALNGAGSIKTDSASKAVVAMTQTVSVIASSLSILSLIAWDKLLAATVALSSVLLSMAGVFSQLGKVKSAKSYQPILAMIGAIVLISYELKKLADIPWDALLSSATALSEVLLATSAAFNIISSANPKAEKVGLFLLSLTSLLMIATSLAALSNFPWSGLLAAGTALSETILAYSIAFKIISTTKPNMASIGLFVAASASLVLVAASIAILAEYPWQGLLASSTAISEVLLAMSVAMGICTLVGTAAGPAIAGIGLLDIFIGNITLVFTAMGALFKSEGAQALLNGGIEALVTIANGLARIVDAFVGGTIEKLSERLPAIAENLSKFMDNLNPFLNGSLQVDDGMVDSVYKLSKMILALTGAELLQGIASFLGMGNNSLATFGEQLKEFGPMLEEFADSVSGIESGAVDGAVDVTKKLITVADLIPNSGGLAALVAGDNTLAMFGEQLKGYGIPLKRFVHYVDGISEGSVDGAVDVTKKMITVADLIPNSGGFAAVIAGDNTLSMFGEQLKGFGLPLKHFVRYVEDIAPGSVDGAVDVTKKMVQVADLIPNSGGLAALVAGDNSLDMLGQQLKGFGLPLKRFVNYVEDISAGSVDGAVDVTKKLIGLMDEIPNSGGLAAIVAGDNTLSMFGTELNNFHPALTDFVDAVTEISPGSVDGVVDVTKKLITLMDSLSESGGVSELWEGRKSFSLFGKDISEFGNYISSFSDTVANVDTEGIYAAIEGVREIISVCEDMIQIDSGALGSFGDALVNVAQVGISQFVATFRDAGPQVTEAVNAMFQAVNTALVSGVAIINSGCQQVGISLASAIARGINSQQGTAVSAVSTLCTVLITKARTTLNAPTFNTIGVTAMNGLQTGIQSRQSAIIMLMTTTAQSAIRSLQGTFTAAALMQVAMSGMSGFVTGIQSQMGSAMAAASIVGSAAVSGAAGSCSYGQFYSIGANAAIGLADGIRSRINEIATAAINAARSAVNSAKSALNEHSPSKVFYEIGEFVDLGLANGIRDYTKVVTRASKRMSEETIEGSRNAMDGLNQFINGLINDDIAPVITPTMDLSQIQGDYANLTSMLNQGINSTYALASGINTSFTSPMEQQTMDMSSMMESFKNAITGFPQPEAGPTYYNTFEIHGEDPETIAQEVSILLQKQVERKEAVWGT